MHPRILLRTHYQADEPRIIIAVVTACSSPTESRQESVVASSLKSIVLRWGHEFGLPAAAYAVDNTRSIGFLNRSNRWTAAGLALAFLAENQPDPAPIEQAFELSPSERMLYSRQYLAGAGALVINFGRWLLERGESTEDELRRGGIVERLIVDSLDEYLSIAVNIRDRTAIRQERDRIRGFKYKAITQRHKRRPLLTTMRRLYLLQEDPQGIIRPDPDGRLSRLCHILPDIAALERAIANGTGLRAALQAVHQNNADPTSDQPLLLSAQLGRAYTYAMGLGLQACPLEYLDRVLEATIPLSCLPRGTPGVADLALGTLHKERPRDVRFHVDRQGRRAFVVLSDLATRHLLDSTEG